MTTNGKLRVAGLLCVALTLMLDFYSDARYRFLADSAPIGTYSILRATLPHNTSEWLGIVTKLTLLYMPLLTANCMHWRSREPALLTLLLAVFAMLFAGHEAWDIALQSVGSNEDLDAECDGSFSLWIIPLIIAWFTGLLLSVAGLIAWVGRRLPGARATSATLP
jgi:hypothetical protein